MWLSCCKIGMVTLPAADFAHFSSICRHSKDITSYINFGPGDLHDGDHDVGSKFLKVFSQIHLISNFLVSWLIVLFSFVKVNRLVESFCPRLKDLSLNHKRQSTVIRPGSTPVWGFGLHWAQTVKWGWAVKSPWQRNKDLPPRELQHVANTEDTSIWNFGNLGHGDKFFWYFEKIWASHIKNWKAGHQHVLLVFQLRSFKLSMKLGPKLIFVFGLSVNFICEKVLIFCNSGSTIRKLLPDVEKQNCFLPLPRTSLAVGNEDMVGLFEWALMELEAK